jgi:repressor LexA
MEPLTLRQQEVLGFLQCYMREEHTWPSFREIEAHFGFKSTNAVMGHLKALERKGYISRVPGQARTFRITSELDEQSRPPESLDVVEIPVYGAIAAGFAEASMTQNEIGRIQIDARTAGISKVRRSFALRVRGESMVDAGIFDGDTVIVEQMLPNDGNIVAALIDGETTLKRFVQKPGCSAYLKAENKSFPSLYPVAELVIQGVVKALVRQL